MKILLTLLLCLMLTGCVSEHLYQTEPPTAITDSAYLSARCSVIEGSAIVPKPFESGVYTSEKEWLRAVKACGIKDLEDVADRYDKSFFELNSLCVLATCSSGGKNYGFVSAKLITQADSTELVIIASYNPMTMVNSLSGYYFLLQLNKAECSAADTINLNEYPRIL